jgi:hypothetical protein
MASKSKNNNETLLQAYKAVDVVMDSDLTVEEGVEKLKDILGEDDQFNTLGKALGNVSYTLLGRLKYKVDTMPERIDAFIADLRRTYPQKKQYVPLPPTSYSSDEKLEAYKTILSYLEEKGKEEPSQDEIDNMAEFFFVGLEIVKITYTPGLSSEEKNKLIEKLENRSPGDEAYRIDQQLFIFLIPLIAITSKTNSKEFMQKSIKDLEASI